MNHFSYEVMGKEKVKGLIEEGVRNQTVYGSTAPKRIVFRLTRLILALMGVLAIVEMLVR